MNQYSVDTNNNFKRSIEADVIIIDEDVSITNHLASISSIESNIVNIEEFSKKKQLKSI